MGLGEWRFIFAACALLGCFPLSAQVTLVKQWHPSPGTLTTDIKKSKTLKEWPNQIDIFNRVSAMIKENRSRVVLVEGCEGEIDSHSTLSHYGWNYELLKKNFSTPRFPDILAHIGLKLKVAFKDKVKIICADNNKLIKEHLLAMSDMRAFLQFFSALKRHQQDPQRFAAYKKALMGNKKGDPFLYAQKKSQCFFDKVFKTPSSKK